MISKATLVSSSGGEEIKASIERKKTKQKNCLLLLILRNYSLHYSLRNPGVASTANSAVLHMSVATEMAGVNQVKEAQAKLEALWLSLR